ncbi:50S ribosomal protein L18e [Candidatus Woesearchaeota archaeon]|nr:50S ribosomal protein L18e [Candidatus Woesearchaeota archaeon]
MKRIKNDQLTSLIAALKKLSIEKKVALWKQIAVELEKPTRSQREVNLYKIEDVAKDGEIIIVPGKVLSNGVVQKPIKVAALNFSSGARDKIISAKGEVLSIQELMKQNPEGKKVRIMG